MRIERRLNRLPGYEARVNFATDTARGRLPAGAELQEAMTRVVATVERLGYTAAPPPADPVPPTDDVPGPVRAFGRWRTWAWPWVGADATIEVAGVTVVRADPLLAAIRLSRATLHTIRGNLFPAFTYAPVTVLRLG